jgi:hypothetical protein
MPASTRQGIYKAPSIALEVLDIAALRPGEESVPGVYLSAFAGGFDLGTGIDGAGYAARRQSPPAMSVYVSRDNGTTFHFAASVAQATQGRLLHIDGQVDSTFGAGKPWGLHREEGIGLADGFDALSEMPIQWRHGFVPTTTTDAELQNGANTVIVNGEVIQFKTVAAQNSQAIVQADRTANGIYYHKTLIRGRRGSEDKIASQTHGTVVYLDDAVTFYAIRPADLNRELIFRAVSAGGDIAAAENVTITPTGRNVLPFAPANVRGVRDASNNITISWDRRSRSEVRLFGTPAFPYGEDTDNYEVEILSVAEPRTVLRTISVTGASSTTYTAANQTSDGLTPGAKMYLKVRQLSNIAGKGIQGQWSIPANAGGAGTPTPSATLYGTRFD